MVGDFNGDGLLDLAVADSDFMSFYVWILLGQGDGSFRPPARITTLGYSPSFVAVGDLNGDGVLDLAVITDVRHVPVSLFEVDVLIGSGDGSFRIGGLLGAAGSRRGLVMAKLAGPEAPDVLALPVRDDNEVDVATFSRNGGVQTTQTFGGSAEAVGDFDGDGRLDLIFSTDSGFAVLFNNTPQ